MGALQTAFAPEVNESEDEGEDDLAPTEKTDMFTRPSQLRRDIWELHQIIEEMKTEAEDLDNGGSQSPKIMDRLQFLSDARDLEEKLEFKRAILTTYIETNDDDDDDDDDGHQVEGLENEGEPGGLGSEEADAVTGADADAEMGCCEDADRYKFVKGLLGGECISQH